MDTQLAAARKTLNHILRGKEKVVDLCIIALLSKGHVLLEDLPGVGKTTLAYALAKIVNGSFQRIQFTSDMLPTDVIGVNVFLPQEKEFVFKPGPIFANFVLADELNRTSPKTQSSLLEVMERGIITVDGTQHMMPQPYMVIATQNPMDYESTFTLPDSQLDRFLISLSIGFPEFDAEMEVLAREFHHYDQLKIDPIFSPESLIEWQARVHKIYVDPEVARFLLQIIHATRDDPLFRKGVSTRGAISLQHAARAAALLNGREYVSPEDIQQVLAPVLGHRLQLTRSVALEKMREEVRMELNLLFNRFEQP